VLGGAPVQWGIACGMRSEERDHAGVVRILLRHGVDRAVTCQNGTGDTSEILMPLILARRCDAGEEINSMLKYGIEGRPTSDEGQSTKDETVPVQRYNISSTNVCDACLGVSFYNAPCIL
jgi:hypothetical protein